MGRKTTMENIIRILLYPEGGDWVAHCLEFDLMGHGPRIRDAVKSLVGVIKTQHRELKKSGQLEDMYHPAPMEYWKLWNKAEPIGEAEIELDKAEVKIPRMKLPVSEMAALNLKYREARTHR